MIFGMPTLIEIQEIEATMELCKELDLNFVELNMNLPQYQVGCLEKTDLLQELQEKYQIGYTIHLDENLNVCDFNKAVSEAYMDTVRRTIEVAKVIKVPVLNMHMNHGVHFTLPNQKVQLFEEYKKDYMDSWKIFRSMCEELTADADIKICIENTNGFRDYEKEAIDYLLQSKVFGLTWDVGHSHSSGSVDEPFIMSREARLTHFHIHDSLGKKDHMTLGAGEIDLNQRLRMAKKHRCRCVIETKTVEALKQSVRWLRKWEDENGRK